MEYLSVVWSVVFLAFFALLVFLFIWVVVIPDWLLCARCKTRIASIRTWDVTRLGRIRNEEVAANIQLSNSKVCSDCKKYLVEIDFPIEGIWFNGALVEYLKNTPTFLAVFISVASLALSFVALFRERIF